MGLIGFSFLQAAGAPTDGCDDTTPTEPPIDTPTASPTPPTPSNTATPTVLVTPSPTAKTLATPTPSPLPTSTASPLPADTPTLPPGPTATPLGAETTLAACADGLDNDADGYVDCDDWSCYLQSSGASSAAIAACLPTHERELAECQDGLDNDGDGYVDCADFTCTLVSWGATEAAAAWCASLSDTPTPTAVPTATPTAVPTPTPTPTAVPTPIPTPIPTPTSTQAAQTPGDESSLAACTDGIDNDLDDYTDCGDYSCYRESAGASPEAAAYCLTLQERDVETCSDGLDNDGDGYADCEDWSCSLEAYGATAEAIALCVPPTPPPPTCGASDGVCPSGCPQDPDCGDWSCGAPYAGPPTDFDDLEGQTGSALRSALLGQIDDHRVFSYDQAREFMYGIDDDIDIDEEGMVECAYTGTRVEADGTKSPANIFTTEHSWPRNDDADGQPFDTDIHQLFPALGEANTQRSTLWYGDTDCGEGGNPECYWQMGGSEKGQSTTNDKRIFEVRPEYRGDVARAHFYFATRYERSIEEGEEIVLRQWHCEDPPNDRERTRNDGIESHQQNRNPFVDRPDFVLLIPNF